LTLSLKKKKYKGELIMEKIVTQIKQVEQKTHFFYCDNCGAQLGCQTECEDGYYKQLGELELLWRTPKRWYKLHKCLCDTCRNEYLSELHTMLETAGFTLDD
jgi:hypothetical protein